MTNAVTGDAPVEAIDTQPPQKTRDFLFISRGLDFWMIGGVSILLWIPVYFLQDTIGLIKSLSLGIPTTAYFLAYAVNYPHFMMSYKLAYLQGKRFILENWFQLVFVPAGLLLAFFFSYQLWSSPTQGNGFLQFINDILSAVGLATRVGLYPSLGAEILGVMVNLLYFTVGWHYSKQTFGCMMVYAKFDNYRMGNIERNILRYGLLSTWWVSWLSANCAQGSYPFYGLDIHRLNLPYVWFQASYVIVGLMFAFVLVTFVRIYNRDRKLPSINFLVPMCALLIWHVPLFGNPQFFYVLAFFHSLQYFPFVARVEQSRYRNNKRRNPHMRLFGFFAIMVVFGYLFFDYFPNSFDNITDSDTMLKLAFFMISFQVFINVHHYFIDNVLWRFKNREVRELLLD